MSDEEFDEVHEDGDEESSVMRELRKQAREGKQAAAERDALKRDLAFRDAGVPNTKATSYFAKAYDGELDVESIKAAAIEAGFLTEDIEDAEDAVAVEEREAAERVAGAVTGSTDTTPPGYEAEVAAAKNPDELLAVLRKYKIPIAG